MPKYSSIPEIRFVLKYENNILKIESNGVDITDMVAREGKIKKYRIYEDVPEEDLEIILDSLFVILNCGLTSFHYYLEGTPKPVKLVDGEPKEFLEIEEILLSVKSELLSDDMKKAISDTKDIKNIEVIKSELMEVKKENKNLQEIQNKDWEDIKKNLVQNKPFDNPKDTKDFEGKVDNISNSGDKDAIAGKIFDFISNIPKKEIESIISGNKIQFKGFRKIMYSSDVVHDKIKKNKGLFEALQKL